MKISILIITSIILCSCGFTGSIVQDEANLIEVSTDLSFLTSDLESYKLSEGGYPTSLLELELSEHYVLDERTTLGADYTYSLVKSNAKVLYKFSYLPIAADLYELRVHDIKYFYTLGSLFECSMDFRYNSKEKYRESSVLKKVGGWALISECHA